jgi:hypothetical protein
MVLCAATVRPSGGATPRETLRTPDVVLVERWIPGQVIAGQVIAGHVIAGHGHGQPVEAQGRARSSAT